MKCKLFILLFFSIIFSCQSDDLMIDDPMDNPPTPTNLELFYTQNDDGMIEFSWSDLSVFDSVSAFGGMFFSNENIIIDSFIPPVGVSFQLPFQGVYINVPTSKTFTVYDEEVIPYRELLYAKLVIVVNGEPVESNVVEINSPQLDIINTDEIGTEFMLANPIQFSGYFYNNTNQELTHYDFENHNIISQVELPFPVDYKSNLIFGNNGFGDEIYLSLNDDRIIIYDATTLEYKGEVMIDGFVNEMATNLNGLIVASIDNIMGDPIIVIDRSITSVVNSFGSPDLQNFATQVIFTSKAESKLLIRPGSNSFNEYYTYDLNNDGTIENQDQLNNPFNIIGSNVIRMSPDEKYFIVKGKVYDVNTFELVSDFGTSFFSVRSDDAYSEDVTKALAFTNFSNTLAYINFPELDILQKIRFLPNDFSILRNGNNFYLLGKIIPYQEGGFYLAKLDL